MTTLLGFDSSELVTMPPKTRYDKKGTQHKQLESPHWTHVFRGVLSVFVLDPVGEGLEPRGGRKVLKRRPIVTKSKITNTLKVVVHQFHFPNRSQEPIRFSPAS